MSAIPATADDAPLLERPASEAVPVVRFLDSTDLSAWEPFVASCPDGTCFHRSFWGQVIEETYGHKADYLAAFEGENITGILPLIFVDSPFFGKSLISTGFTVGGGIVAANATAQAALAQAAARLGEQRGVQYVELRGGAAPAGWAEKPGTYASFVREMTADEDENLKAIPRKKRADVRKGIKAAAEGRFLVVPDAEPDRFYALYAESVRNLGTPVFPKKLIRSLKERFADDLELSVIEADGKDVAGLASFYHGQTVLPYYGGAKPAARALHAYDYMYWAQMCRAAEKGCTRFDFGRSKTGTGAYNYKSWWGFEPQPLTYYYHLVKAGAVPDINPNNPKFALITKVWQRLPLPLANAVGPLLAGNLA